MSFRDAVELFLKEWPRAKTEVFSKHPIQGVLKNNVCTAVQQILNKRSNPDLLPAKGSVGQGVWADVPWISILNSTITDTTQEGVYPGYLFNSDGSGFYLTLIFGTTNPKKLLGKKEFLKQLPSAKSDLLKIPELNKWGQTTIDLKASTELAKSFEEATIKAKFYSLEHLPSDEVFEQDLMDLLDIYEKIKPEDIIFYETTSTTMHAQTDISTTRLPKPFILLAGISGTGKTRFIREQAKMTGSLAETYCLVPVRPDWHEPSDLLGYVSRLGGTPRYIATDVLRFIVQAWKEATLEVEATKVVKNKASKKNDEISWQLCLKPNEDTRPYWLCLDEMNLAPVEQYFADFLAILETKKRDWTEAGAEDRKNLNFESEHFEYHCDPLIKPELLCSLVQYQEPPNAETTATHEELDKSTELENQIHKNPDPNRFNLLAIELGLDTENELDRQLLQHYFLEHGINLPPNLIVAGTVNMDETTHGFSRKVLDRALTFDFGAFFPNDYDEFFEQKTTFKALSYPIFTHATPELLSTVQADDNGTKTIQFLKNINEILKDTPFELAYRALNELLLSVGSFQPQNEIELQAVWDDFLMCKILPRIEGDQDKLTKNGDILLESLEKLLSSQLDKIWTTSETTTHKRPDLLRTPISGDEPIMIPCRSQKKIAWMIKRLTSSGFTSFWP